MLNIEFTHLKSHAICNMCEKKHLKKIVFIMKSHLITIVSLYLCVLKFDVR